MAELVTGQEWGRLLRTFARSAWRLETQGIYREPYEAEHFRRFLDGEPDDLEWMRDWLDTIRAITQVGRFFGRVRVLTQPLTDYLRWEIQVTPVNIEAGEDIRFLTADQAADLGLPGHDYYLFDDELVARMYFGDQGFLGAELITDPSTVAQHRAWRELAWGHAMTFTDYARTAPTN
jgi:hypothetical protein